MADPLRVLALSGLDVRPIAHPSRSVDELPWMAEDPPSVWDTISRSLPEEIA
jgi:hypothetical protein